MFVNAAWEITINVGETIAISQKSDHHALFVQISHIVTTVSLFTPAILSSLSYKNRTKLYVMKER